MAADPRERTKTWIETYYTAGDAMKDDGTSQLGVQVMYESPDYPMELEFKAPSVVDVIVAIGQPNSSALIGHDRTIQAYEEHVPIKIYAVNKSGVTAVKAIWQVEAALRTVAEEHPEGSQRDFENRRPATQVLGSTTLYGSEWMLSYRRLKG